MKPHRNCKTPSECLRACVCLDGWHCAHGKPLEEIFTEEQRAKHRAQDALYEETMKTP